MFRGCTQVTAVDVNYWGVTFARDSDRFYATIATSGKTYLIEGSVGHRRAHVLHENVECPSLSPDGTRIAYKTRTGSASAPWRLTVLDLATMRETPLGEARSVDDQVEWLDDAHVLYGVDGAVWKANADGTGEPQRYIARADSPAAVRWSAPPREKRPGPAVPQATCAGSSDRLGRRAARGPGAPRADVRGPGAPRARLARRALGGRVGLGIQRLRVIDLDTGDQPIYNEDGSVVVVLNGEIYNYAELRASLRRTRPPLRHQGRHRGDRPPLRGARGRLRAPAARDVRASRSGTRRRQRLLLARDRVGKKPLFYALRDGVLSFASELRALLAGPRGPARGRPRRRSTPTSPTATSPPR